MIDKCNTRLKDLQKRYKTATESAQGKIDRLSLLGATDAESVRDVFVFSLCSLFAWISRFIVLFLPSYAHILLTIEFYSVILSFSVGSEVGIGPSEDFSFVGRGYASQRRGSVDCH